MHAWMMMDGGRLVMLRVAEEQAGGWELPVQRFRFVLHCPLARLVGTPSLSSLPAWLCSSSRAFARLISSSQALRRESFEIERYDHGPPTCSKKSNQMNVWARYRLKFLFETLKNPNQTHPT